MDAPVGSAVSEALARTSTNFFEASLPDPAPILPSIPTPQKNRVPSPQPELASTVDSGSDGEGESQDESETEEDRAFINDGKVDKVEYDAAAINNGNILHEKRRRKAATRWEHPDTDLVMKQYMKRKGITSDDLEALEEDYESGGSTTDDTETTEDENFESDGLPDEGESEFDSDFNASGSDSEGGEEEEYCSTSTNSDSACSDEESPAPTRVPQEVLDGPEVVVVEQGPPAKKRRSN